MPVLIGSRFYLFFILPRTLSFVPRCAVLMRA
jgi:hypothetical protein